MHFLRGDVLPWMSCPPQGKKIRQITLELKNYREKFNHIESKLQDMESIIVRLTSHRAEIEEALHSNVSPKKSRFRPSIKRGKRESSKTSSSSQQTLDG